MRLFNQIAALSESVKSGIKVVTPSQKAMAFFILFLSALLAPNILLALSGKYSLPSIFAGILLPMGVYLIIGATVRFTGGLALLMSGVAAMCAFQIVLIHIFGGTAIAADMFINLTTTNSGEAGELLANISEVVVIVVFVYASLLILALHISRKRMRLNLRMRRVMTRVGVAMIAVSVATLLLSRFNSAHSVLLRDIFPVNAIYNLRASLNTHLSLRRYKQTSSEFRFDAHRSKTATRRELYIYIIGEASRRASWGVFGYDRNTTPRLAERSDIILLKNILTQSNTTHKSVPLLLSGVSASNYKDLYSRRGICALFKEAGFLTCFISNQQRQGAMVDYLAAEADTLIYLKENGHDEVLLGAMQSLLQTEESRPLLVVLHCYGSHYDYRERYPAEFSHWQPDHSREFRDHRKSIVNSYDNSILYTDYMLSSIIDYVESLDYCASILYCSDHGEDLYDDERGRFLHSSPTLSRFQVQIPAFIWFSPDYEAEFPNKVAATKINCEYICTSHSMFHTMANIANIESRFVEQDASFANVQFDSEQSLYYLDDYNEAVPFTDKRLGLSDRDIAAMGLDKK